MPADTTPDLMTMSVICGLYIYNSNTFNKSHKPFLVSSQHYCMKKQYDSHEDVKLRSNERTEYCFCPDEPHVHGWRLSPIWRPTNKGQQVRLVCCCNSDTSYSVLLLRLRPF